jgi:phosphonoacetaldehyde hydrolase
VGAKIGGTTGYFREAADLCLELAKKQGYEPDANVCGDDVPVGRPAPWMVYRVMEKLGTCPPATVVKLGDTVIDIEEGLNAGCWSGAVLSSSSEMGMPALEYAALPTAERTRRLAEVRQRFQKAGAHFTVDTLFTLPSVVHDISGRLSRGEKP